MIQLFKPLRLPASASTGLLAVRLVAGLAFVFHGLPKIKDPFGWMGPESAFPAILIGLAALSEFGGGLAWMLGLVTPLASFGLACTMGVATWMHAIQMGDAFVASARGQGSYELPAVFLAIAILFLLAGPGRFSADRAIFGERS